MTFKQEAFYYLLIIGLLCFYIFIANSPKYMECQVTAPNQQQCTVINLLGR